MNTVSKPSLKSQFSISLQKHKPVRAEVEEFEQKLQILLSKIDEIEREENQKNHIRDFLRDAFYSSTNEINTKGDQDMVIHNGLHNKSTVGVIIEAKRPSNKSEMVSVENLNCKALQELVLYYLRERISEKNLDLKYLIVTNVYSWFVFDAQEFEKNFAQNKNLVRQFEAFERGEMGGRKTEFFYKEIAYSAIEKVKLEIPFIHFDIRDYANSSQSKTVDIYKLFSPYFLLKKPLGNDSNELNKEFYHELLYIMGLEEKTEIGKKLITRASHSQSGTLLENLIEQIQIKNPISDSQELFETALAIVILWINRILFLKLLEGQLVSFNKSNDYKFLTTQKISDYDELNNLFFQVLAITEDQRIDRMREKFALVPYLNSSLFEYSQIEKEYSAINGLTDKIELPVYAHTVLKDQNNKRLTKSLPPLEYLLSFLDSYDFGSESKTDTETVEESKTIINASVLGLIFEKINGYKDGSFFTPGFITSYMARKTVEKAIIAKFNQYENNQIESFEDLKNYTRKYFKTEDLLRFNNLIDTLKIVDPAVGSGHFLVSVLNQILAIKSELGILQDQNNGLLSDQIKVENDEIIIKNRDGEIFEYNPKNSQSQITQKTIFHEKQKIIENCLFGVDINPNSVKICQLRLWIELLKNAYYLESEDSEKLKVNSEKSATKNSPLEEYPQSGGGVSPKTSDIKIPRQPTVATPLVKGNYRPLQTLPNIDINIKCGNSLISRFKIDSPLSKILKDNKLSIQDYKTKIYDYQNTSNKEEKKKIKDKLDQIKVDLQKNLLETYPLKQKLKKLESDLFGIDKKIEKQIAELKIQIDDLENNKIYQKAFEWRFEFPQVLDENGDFVGFDVVIGNPPYIGEKGNKDIFQAVAHTEFGKKFYQGKMDLFYFFFHKSFDILADSGILSFITTNYYITATGGVKLRQDLQKRSIILELLNFNEVGIFESATGQHNLVTTVQKKEDTDSSTFYWSANKDSNILAKTFVTHNKNNIDETLIVDILEEKDPNTSYYQIPQTKLFDENGYVKLTAGGLDNILDKMLVGNKRLGWICEVNKGIVTGADKVSDLHLSKYNGNFKKGDGIFVLEEVEKSKLALNNFEKNRIRNWFKNSDIYKYSTNTSNSKFLIDICYPADKNIDKNLIGNLLQHLDKFKIILENRKTTANGLDKVLKNGYWWTLESKRKVDFEGSKIIAPQRSKTNTFGYNETAWYASADVYFITQPKENYNLKFLLGVLNSKLIYKWLYYRGKRKGEMLELYQKPLSEIPIPTLETPEKQEIARRIEVLVEEILKVKKDENRRGTPLASQNNQSKQPDNGQASLAPTADTDHLESQIDELVFDLYGLREEERRTVFLNSTPNRN